MRTRTTITRRTRAKRVNTLRTLTLKMTQTKSLRITVILADEQNINITSAFQVGGQ